MKFPFWLAASVFLLSVVSAHAPAWGQDSKDGALLFRTYCTSCHTGAADSRAPSPDALKQMMPEQIFAALEKGEMRLQGTELSQAEKRLLAEFVSEKKFGTAPENPIPKSAFCNIPSNSFRNSLAGPAWNGWGVTTANTRFVPGDVAGIFAKDVPRLKLKWAFGFPGDSSASAQPVLSGGRVYVGSWGGDVFSLDANTGCIYWMFEAEAGVRSAVSLGTPGGVLTVYFGDLSANIYAVNAATGEVLWKVKVDDYPLSRITGSPTLDGTRLYVPVSSHEESQAADPAFVCCKFRGSVVALDASSGKQIWKTYTLPEAPRPTEKTRLGTQLWGPSGIAVWNAPTVDPKQDAIYVGTGNYYSGPVSNTSDAVMALSRKTGKMLWVRQLTQGDIWNGACPKGARDTTNCPDGQDSPDFDFASSPILVEPKGGRRMLLAAQKSGMVYALDPDRKGELIWQQRAGKGGTSGGIMWGSATDGENLYVAVSDQKRGDPTAGGGMVAIAVHDGTQIWKTPAPSCGDKKVCSPAQTAAVSAIPGAVFSGSIDGHIRAYATHDGSIIWDYDTAHDYAAVNGVEAKGGSISDGGPAIVGGMLFTNSGYSHHSGIMPGNVLLAFSVE